MNLKVETIITKDLNGFSVNNSRIYNQVRNIVASDNFPVSSMKLHEFEIPYAEKDSICVNLADICSDVSQISSIVAFCFQQVESENDLPIPVRFKYEIGSAAIISSQLSIINCEPSDLDGLSFYAFQVQPDKKATFTIAITYR